MHADNVASDSDELSLFYTGRYTHSFFRSWESAGLREFKAAVDRQISHNIAVTYMLRSPVAKVSTTLEVQNLTDARLFDLFGVRPGRAIFLKLTSKI